MTIDPTNEIFDLYQVFVNEVIGDIWLSIIIFLIVIFALSIKLKMPIEASMLFGLLVLAAMFEATGIIILWVFPVLIIGLLFYWSISKAIGG